MMTTAGKPSFLQRLYVGTRYYLRENPVASKVEAAVLFSFAWYALVSDGWVAKLAVFMLFVVNANIMISWYDSYQKEKVKEKGSTNRG